VLEEKGLSKAQIESWEQPITGAGSCVSRVRHMEQRIACMLQIGSKAHIESWEQPITGEPGASYINSYALMQRHLRHTPKECCCTCACGAGFWVTVA
jgi:hypothetical protein